MRKKKKRSFVAMDGVGRKRLRELFFSLLFLFYLGLSYGHGTQDSHVDDNGSDDFCEVMRLASFLLTLPSNNCPINRVLESQNFLEIETVTEHRDHEQESDTGSIDGLKQENIEAFTLKTYLGLDEFRNLTLQRRKRDPREVFGKITQRLEPGGSVYNYASSSRGAKVLAHNKEAKGATSILCRDKDKYLRNPCSAGGKFVTVELSEETLVNSIEIANLEHYSSNFKDFELLGSLEYPTEKWVLLGHFFAQNVKHKQSFILPEPRWTRYMRLNLVSHYGSEFYCTLSYLEVYGVDAVEMMLEDLIVASNESSAYHVASLNLEDRGHNDFVRVHNGVNFHVKVGNVNGSKNDISKGNVFHLVKEVKYQSAGRGHSDAVLKILMQKIRSLELSLSTLEEYLRALNLRYGDALLDFQKGFSQYSKILENIKSDIGDLMNLKEYMVKELSKVIDWKTSMSVELDAFVRENAVLRANVEKIKSDQEILHDKELALLSMCFFFTCLAFFKLVCDRILVLFKASDPKRVLRTSRGWLLALAVSSMATLILLLCS